MFTISINGSMIDTNATIEQAALVWELMGNMGYGVTVTNSNGEIISSEHLAGVAWLNRNSKKI